MKEDQKRSADEESTEGVDGEECEKVTDTFEGGNCHTGGRLTLTFEVSGSADEEFAEIDKGGGASADVSEEGSEGIQNLVSSAPTTHEQK
ncbi:CCAAT/enhancer-binding protein zeta [Fukomys damarensis]|uniref:CCAAT/enhancer-binding protein zeta n=1 Tax=Fukomys damarensis TaxID=885580 RepID=A0A091ERI3_FUKDA|nr:CCAAT/enhancer-binding protein zeta [Fukomys damarensis]